MWPGLRLFSPSTYSSLPGWMMPAWDDRRHGYPPRDHVVDYLTRYEDRYTLAVRRPVRVSSVTSDGDGLVVASSAGSYRARAVVSATGTWRRPFWPRYPGQADFGGRQLHAADYDPCRDRFAGQRVAVVGGGNSAAQILAEVSETADTTWVTSRPPRFLPDDVDGRDLFAAATARVQALREGRHGEAGVGGLGDIVMVPAVRDARDRGVLKAQPTFTRLTTTGIGWADRGHLEVNVVIWCTGFRPDLRHLRPLGLRTRGRIRTGGRAGTQSLNEPRLHLVGYGDWTGPASATIVLGT